MSYTSNPAKMPAAFYLLLDRVAAEREVHIPISNPKSLYPTRGELQNFLRVLVRTGHPRAAEAENLMVRLAPPGDPRGQGLLVCERDRSPTALAVLAALGVEDSGGQNAESSLADLLTPNPGESNGNLSHQILPILPARIPTNPPTPLPNLDIRRERPEDR